MRLSALVFVVCIAIAGFSLSHIASSNVEMIDKQQAAWGVVPAEDWDQGWMHKFTHPEVKNGPILMQKSPAALGSRSSSGPSIEKVNELMTEAVGMLKDLKAEEAHRPVSSLSDGAPAAPVAPVVPPANEYVPNKYDLERNAKYAEQQGLSKSLPMCFKINKFDDIAKNEAQRRMSEATSQLGKAYPDWAKGLSIPGVGQTGEWRHNRSCPTAHPTLGLPLKFMQGRSLHSPRAARPCRVSDAPRRGALQGPAVRAAPDPLRRGRRRHHRQRRAGAARARAEDGLRQAVRPALLRPRLEHQRVHPQLRGRPVPVRPPSQASRAD
jgi:hypothetical protein